jgi:hypothetical protein
MVRPYASDLGGAKKYRLIRGNIIYNALIIMG